MIIIDNQHLEPALSVRCLCSVDLLRLIRRDVQVRDLGIDRDQMSIILKI